MDKLANVVVTKLINVGTPQLLMGIMWLYLWAFPWRPAYLAYPHWGHNYTQSLAFLCVGLAYFNRRLISEWFALAASLLVIPAALELLPHMTTASIGAAFAVLIMADWIIEWKRKQDLGQSSNRRLTLWLKKHLIRFAFIMLAHISFTYFFVRLPSGTYEDSLVTKVFDGMLIVFVTVALFEGAAKKCWGMAITQVGFFWGMLAIIVPLILMFDQPETRIFLAFSIIFSVLAIVSLLSTRQLATGDA
jgi:hypothetical protein